MKRHCGSEAALAIPTELLLLLKLNWCFDCDMYRTTVKKHKEPQSDDICCRIEDARYLKQLAE